MQHAVVKMPVFEQFRADESAFVMESAPSRSGWGAVRYCGLSFEVTHDERGGGDHAPASRCPRHILPEAATLTSARSLGRRPQHAKTRSLSTAGLELLPGFGPGNSSLPIIGYAVVTCSVLSYQIVKNSVFTGLSGLLPCVTCCNVFSLHVYTFRVYVYTSVYTFAARVFTRAACFIRSQP